MDGSLIIVIVHIKGSSHRHAAHVYVNKDGGMADTRRTHFFFLQQGIVDWALRGTGSVVTGETNMENVHHGVCIDGV